MRFKYKAIIWIVTIAVLYLFRYEIAGHFGLEDMLPPKEQTPVPSVSMPTQSGSAEAPVALPPYAVITGSEAKIYRNPGRGSIATGNRGDQLTVLDTKDTGQRYINVRYNGIAGYINRSDLDLNQ